MLKGYGTYTAGIIAILVAILSQVFGWFDAGNNLIILFMGFTALGLRRAIGNNNNQ